jgi:ubiquinone/menaquinone biosynthesis C-methylase UbiE
MRLDVGSGTQPTGDVNVDIGPYQRDCEPSLRTVGVQIYCDYRHLPFRDKAFDVAYSRYVIEHVQDPNGMLRELERVATHATVVTAHWLSRTAKSRSHRWSFHVSWFLKHGYSVVMTNQEIRLLLFSLLRVNEIIADKDCP